MLRFRSGLRSLAIICVMAPVFSSHADDGTSGVWPVPLGTHGGAITGRLHGAGTTGHAFDAKAGQRVVVSFAATNPNACIDLIAPDGERMLYSGNSGESGFELLLVETGTYRIDVKLMPAAGERGERADYRLSIRLTPA